MLKCVHFNIGNRMQINKLNPTILYHLNSVTLPMYAISVNALIRMSVGNKPLHNFTAISYKRDKYTAHLIYLHPQPPRLVESLNYFKNYWNLSSSQFQQTVGNLRKYWMASSTILTSNKHNCKFTRCSIVSKDQHKRLGYGQLCCSN